eukprot:7528535-Pyramimonas_sp.AAC.1
MFFVGCPLVRDSASPRGLRVLPHGAGPGHAHPLHGVLRRAGGFLGGTLVCSPPAYTICRGLARF